MLEQIGNVRAHVEQPLLEDQHSHRLIFPEKVLKGAGDLPGSFLQSVEWNRDSYGNPIGEGIGPPIFGVEFCGPRGVGAIRGPPPHEVPPWYKNPIVSIELWGEDGVPDNVCAHQTIDAPGEDFPTPRRLKAIRQGLCSVHHPCLCPDAAPTRHPEARAADSRDRPLSTRRTLGTVEGYVPGDVGGNDAWGNRRSSASRRLPEPATG